MTANRIGCGVSAEKIESRKKIGRSAALEGCSILMSDLVMDTEQDDEDVTFVPYG